MFLLSSSHGFSSALLPRTISVRSIAHLLGVVPLTAAALKSHQLAIGAWHEKLALSHCRALLDFTCPSIQEVSL
jgi:hypothetical protein